MSNEKRIAYQESVIKELKSRIKVLESEKSVLEKDNQFLTEANEMYQSSIDGMKEEQEKAFAEIVSARIKLAEAIKEYNEQRDAFYAERKEYTKKVEQLLSRITNTKI